MKKNLSPEKYGELLKTLKLRFEKNMNRHDSLEWTKVQAKLETNTEKLYSLNEMEITEGEPDVVGYDKKTGEYIFYDCSAESPKGRRSICYDHEALEKRKEFKPEDRAINGRTIQDTAAIGKFRFKNIELGTNTCRDQEAWWCCFL